VPPSSYGYKGDTGRRYHIDTVRGTVAAAQWCTGHERAQKPQRGILSKLFAGAADSNVAA